MDRQLLPRPSREESHAYLSQVPLSFPILNSNNFTIGDEATIECLSRMRPSNEHEVINEFMTIVNCLDEPPLVIDPALGDNTLVTVSSRISNNAYMPRINLLASNSNLLSTEVVSDSDGLMVKEVFESKETIIASSSFVQLGLMVATCLKLESITMSILAPLIRSKKTITKLDQS
ncbi:hypothetical protein WN943_027033 [Citrus x changshan-huyou]